MGRIEPRKIVPLTVVPSEEVFHTRPLGLHSLDGFRDSKAIEIVACGADLAASFGGG